MPTDDSTDHAPGGTGQTAPSYAESLYVPMSWWLIGGAFAVTVWWVFVLATPMAVAVTAGVVAALAVGLLFWSYGRIRVGVEDGMIHAGNARIEPEFCGAATALDPEQTVALRGRDADARAYLLLRPYVSTTVRLDIDDDRDPAPYWLISSRHPQLLADAIEAARAADSRIKHPEAGPRMQD